VEIANDGEAFLEAPADGVMQGCDACSTGDRLLRRFIVDKCNEPPLMKELDVNVIEAIVGRNDGPSYELWQEIRIACECDLSSLKEKVAALSLDAIGNCRDRPAGDADLLCSKSFIRQTKASLVPVRKQRGELVRSGEKLGQVHKAGLER